MYDNSNDQHHDLVDKDNNPSTSAINSSILSNPDREDRIVARPRLPAVPAQPNGLLPSGDVGGMLISRQSDDGNNWDAGGVKGVMLATVEMELNRTIDEDEALDSDTTLGFENNMKGGNRNELSRYSSSPLLSFFKIQARQSNDTGVQLSSSSSIKSFQSSNQSDDRIRQQRSVLCPAADASTSALAPAPAPAPLYRAESASAYIPTQSFFSSPTESPRHHDRKSSRLSSFTLMNDDHDGRGCQAVKDGDFKPRKKGKGIESIVNNKSGGDGRVGGLMRSLRKGFAGGSSRAGSWPTTTLSRLNPSTDVQSLLVRPPSVQSHYTTQSQLQDVNVGSTTHVQNPVHEQSLGIDAFRLDRRGSVSTRDFVLGSQGGQTDTSKGDPRRERAASQDYSPQFQYGLAKTRGDIISLERLRHSPHIKYHTVGASFSSITEAQIPSIRPVTPTSARNGELHPNFSPRRLSKTGTLIYPSTPSSSSSSITATSSRLSSMSDSSHFTSSSQTSEGSSQRRRPSTGLSGLGAACLPPMGPAPVGFLPSTPQGNDDGERSLNEDILSAAPPLNRTSSSQIPIAAQLDSLRHDGEIHPHTESVMHFVDPIDGKSYAIPPSLMNVLLGAGIRMETSMNERDITSSTIPVRLLHSPSTGSSQEMTRASSGTSMMSVSSMDGVLETTPLYGFLDLPAIQPPLRSPGGTLDASTVNDKVPSRVSMGRVGWESDVGFVEPSRASCDQRERLRSSRCPSAKEWDEGVVFGLKLEDDIVGFGVSPMGWKTVQRVV